MKLRLETVDDWFKLLLAIGSIYSFCELLKIIEDARKVVELPEHLRDLNEMQVDNQELALQQNATADELLLTGSVDGVPLTDEERRILEGVRDRSAQGVDENTTGVLGWFSEAFSF